MRSSLAAGALYALIVFAAAFALGMWRTLVVAPRLGVAAAVLLEVPIVLAISWLVSRRCTACLRIQRDRAQRLLMGAAALLVLLACEWSLALWIFQRSVSEVIAGYRSVAGAVGLAAQFAFAFIPLLQARGKR